MKMNEKVTLNGQPSQRYFTIFHSTESANTRSNQTVDGYAALSKSVQDLRQGITTDLEVIPSAYIVIQVHYS